MSYPSPDRGDIGKVMDRFSVYDLDRRVDEPAPATGTPLMEQRTEDRLSPYRVFSRAEWASLREDTPMTLASDEVAGLRSLHDRLDMAEIGDISLPLSRLLSLYVVATQRL